MRSPRFDYVAAHNSKNNSLISTESSQNLVIRVDTSCWSSSLLHADTKIPSERDNPTIVKTDLTQRRLFRKSQNDLKARTTSCITCYNLRSIFFLLLKICSSVTLLTLCSFYVFNKSIFKWNNYTAHSTSSNSDNTLNFTKLQQTLSCWISEFNFGFFVHMERYTDFKTNWITCTFWYTLIFNELKLKHWKENCIERFWGRKQNKQPYLNGRKHKLMDTNTVKLKVGKPVVTCQADTFCLPLWTTSLRFHWWNVVIKVKQYGNNVKPFRVFQ
jgi:hypothetical protein